MFLIFFFFKKDSLHLLFSKGFLLDFFQQLKGLFQRHQRHSRILKQSLLWAVVEARGYSIDLEITKVHEVDA